MKALITQRLFENEFGDEVEALECSYVSFFAKEGIQCTPASVYALNIENVVVESDLIVFSGGGDVDRQFYQDGVLQDNLNAKRDELEREIFKIAVQNSKPILGICRGMQHLALMHQSKVDSFKEDTVDHPPGVAHGVEVNGDLFTTNSYHDYCVVEPLDEDLIVWARDSKDDVVEAFEHRSLAIVGVQWHPERSNSDPYLWKEIWKRLGLK